MIIEILAAAFLLGFCIFFHELGHFLAGKLVGIKAQIFSIGYGKGRFSKEVNGTTYQITAIPLGGYVKFYGDDITQEHRKVKKGDFFSVGPWKRIIVAAGGPFFSILLGVLVIAALLLTGWQPITNRVEVSESRSGMTYEVGSNKPLKEILESGDRIIQVNENPTKSFEEINYHVALSPEDTIDLLVQRENKTFQTSIVGNRSAEGSPLQIGIQPIGKRYLLVQSNKKIGVQELKQGDKITHANGVKVNSVAEIRKITDANKGSSIRLDILRKKSGWLANDVEEKISLSAPIQEVEYVSLENILYLKNKQRVAKQEVGPWYKDNLSIFSIEGEKYNNWKEFSSALKYYMNSKKTNRLKFYQKEDLIEADVAFKKRGMIGVSLSEGLEPMRAELTTDLLSLASRTIDQTIFTTKSTLVGLYRIIQGKLSFRKSVSGPIKIFDYARRSVDAGWDVYWFLLANITIILGIMNLLPIPVLDGGHVLFYLIEGVYKPLPIKVISGSVRMGMALLITFGVYVIFIDIWDVIINRLL